jgi:hypothetical protein
VVRVIRRTLLIGIAMTLGALVGWIMCGMLGFGIAFAIGGGPAAGDVAWWTSMVAGLIGAASGAALAGFGASRVARPSS